MYWRFNLGPLHHSDGLVNEFLAFDTKETYKRGEKRIARLPSKDITKVLLSLLLKIRMKQNPESFWNPSSSK